MSGSPSRSARRSTVRYATTSVTSAPCLRSSSATTSRPMSARGSRTLQARDVAALGEGAARRLGAVLGGHEVDLEAVPRQPLGGRRTDGAQLHAAERAQVARRRAAAAP